MKERAFGKMDQTTANRQLKRSRGLFIKHTFSFLTLCQLYNMSILHFAILDMDGNPLHQSPAVEASNNQYLEHSIAKMDNLSSKGEMKRLKFVEPKQTIGSADHEKDTAQISIHSDQHSLAGLSCESYGGPEDASEMIYWSDVPSDATFQSPFRTKKAGEGRPLYLTFEADEAGWNNVQMAMETVVVMAYAMGRTLVIPPSQGVHHLNKDQGKQNASFSFADFFHLDLLNEEHEGIDIISTEEFLHRKAMTGHLVDNIKGQVSSPPENCTKWDSVDIKPLMEWLRNVTHDPKWRPLSCIGVIPASTDASDMEELRGIKDEMNGGKRSNWSKYIGNPVPVDGPPLERIKEVSSRRRELCVYDEEIQKKPFVHFTNNKEQQLLIHFYAFIFFQDWKQDLWAKRFVRDHLRYLDELQCAAARVVQAIRKRARKRDPEGNPHGVFNSFHVRRGDFRFQYNKTQLGADEIYLSSKDVLAENATLFIATDQRKKMFFDPLREHYDVCFLENFKHLLEGVDKSYYGMIDQLVASKGQVFVGTYYSIFTGYINRIRGYFAEKHKLKGYEKGVIQSYYFAPLKEKFAMQDYYPVKWPFWKREFPISWRDIDEGIRKTLPENFGGAGRVG